MEQIIRKAYEVGYRGKKVNSKFDWNEKGVTHDFQLDVRDCILDPLFWSALGKACGWRVDQILEGTTNILSKCEQCKYNTGAICVHMGLKEIYIGEWKNNALRFHEINLTSGWSEAVEYLENLIK